MQPPPRGCVLKLRVDISLHLGKSAAASTRLCVETIGRLHTNGLTAAAASTRLCVETPYARQKVLCRGAAASTRLCVETDAEKFVR